MNIDSTTLKRFWSKVDVVPGCCWEWQAGTDGKGYGKFRFQGKRWFAHRLAYALYVGHIPETLFVLHRCDNPSCVNPNHLFLGTQKENIQDAAKKGRLSERRGEKNTNARLTEEQVLAIRALKGKISQREIAALFGVARSTIDDIHSGRTWKHLENTS